MTAFSPFPIFSPKRLLIACLGAAAACAHAATEAPLRFQAALARAVENNPALAAQLHAGRATEALIEQAGQRPNPTLGVEVENVLGTGNLQGVRSLETTVQASQTFERGGKRDRRIALASRERDAVSLESAVRRTEVLASAAVAYVETLAAQDRLVLAQEPLTLARDMLAAAEARVKAGDAPPTETARARSALATAQAEFARAQAALAAARVALAATWGGQPSVDCPLAGRIQIPDALPGEEAFLARSARHPRLAFQDAVVETRRASLELERAQAVQDVTVGGGVRFLREGTDAAFVAGVSVPLPVRNKNQGAIRAARETLAGAGQSRQAAEIDLRAQVSAVWRQLEAARTAAQMLRRDALPATEDARALVRRAYEEGRLPLIDVLDAQRELVALRREILDAETACVVALARLEGLTDATFPLTNALFATP
jgi:outer membrane protein, heavy metal efflux system